MKIIKLKTVLFLFRLLLFTQIYHHHQFTLVVAIENGNESTLNADGPNSISGENGMTLNERMQKLEDRNRHQEQEIAILKRNAVEDRKVINRLEGRVAQLEGASTAASPLVRSKRLYRLLPITNEEKGDLNNKEQINLQFYGPATNCDELGQLGFTLNGYYLVKNTDKEFESKRGVIDVVHCFFQQPMKGSVKKDVKEERLGYTFLSTTMKLPTQNILQNKEENKMSAISSSTIDSKTLPAKELKLESTPNTIKSAATPSSGRSPQIFGPDNKATVKTQLNNVEYATKSQGIKYSTPVTRKRIEESVCNQIGYFKTKNRLQMESCLTIQQSNSRFFYHTIVLFIEIAMESK